MVTDEQVAAGKSALRAVSIGPATLTAILQEIEDEVRLGQSARLQPLATGFEPLDEVLGGGIRPGELALLGGPYGVGKTIWGLQMARNVVANDPTARALYVCYEHDRAHLLLRLLCLESVEAGLRDEALTLRKVTQMAQAADDGHGLLWRLASSPRYERVVSALSSYQDRLVLARASGDHTTLDKVDQWISDLYPDGPGRLLLVVDYLQKVPLQRELLAQETETTTLLVQSLKELAMSREIAVLAIAAADRAGLKSKRMVLADLRGSSALQYEADVGLILNNKFDIVSREHMVYNVANADAMRNWIVLSVEKNRSGRHGVDVEHILDASHFRIETAGRFVRERLVDDRLTLQ